MSKKSATLLQELIFCRGPSGQEEEVRNFCQKRVKGDSVFVDDAGNLVCHMKGTSKQASKEAIRIMTHLDELSMIVKRVNEDGTLRINALGGIYPFDFGQSPVEILGDSEELPGILSARSIHTTEETKDRWRSMPLGGDKPRRFDEMYIFTGMSKEKLLQKGVHPGTRVVLGTSRRKMEEMGDFLAGHFFDNRVAVAVALTVIEELHKEKKKPLRDLYFVFTVEEEIGAHGASFAARTLPGKTSIAIDVAPAADEYKIELTDQPVIVFQDGISVYTKAVADSLMKCAKKLRMQPQAAILSNYGSDVSLAKRYGQTAEAALIAIPTENTHGLEIIHRNSIDTSARLLKEYLLS